MGESSYIQPGLDSQIGYLEQFCGQFCGLWSPQFIITEGHSIWNVTERIFTARVCHHLLWPKAQYLRSQREAIHWVGHHSLLLPKATTFKKSQWPVNLAILLYYCNCHGNLNGFDKLLNLISFISKLSSVIEQTLGCTRSLEI